MSTIILRLLPVNGGFTAVHHYTVLAASTTASGSGLALIAILGGLAVLVAVIRLLRWVLSTVLSSTGAAMGVLITLLGAGTLLLTTVVVYVVNHR